MTELALDEVPVGVVVVDPAGVVVDANELARLELGCRRPEPAGEHLAGRAGPEVDQAGQRLGDAEGALHDRVGDGSAAYLVEVVAVALQRRTGDRGAEAGLRGDLAAVPAQSAVSVGGVDGFSGAREGGRDLGEVEQRG